MTAPKEYLPPPTVLGLPSKFTSWRRNQDAAAAAVLDSDKRFVCLICPTGFGKCHAYGTEIIRHSGRVTRVEDIRCGDLLMGPDSKPRRVISTVSGRETLWEIVPVKGAPWKCTEDHLLSVVRTGIPFNISVKDYIGRSATFKHETKLWRPAGIDFPRSKVPFDPYIVGLYLADGCKNWCSKLTLGPKKKEALRYVLSQDSSWTTHTKDGCTDVNMPGFYPIRRSLVAEGARHIPEAYLYNSKSVRRKLLAGLLDGDGHLVKKTVFELLCKDAAFCEEVLFLCRSLGLAAYGRACQKGIRTTGFSGTYYRITISGATNTIPTRVPQKQAAKRQQKKSVHKTGFTVRRVGEERYFGFTLEGDGLYLLKDFTVTHNSLTYVAAARLTRGRTVILTSTKALQRQLMTDFGSMGLALIMGRNAYRCLMMPNTTCDDGPCTIGVQCDHKTGENAEMCPYFAAVQRAAMSRVVVTNYSYWYAVNTFSKGLGPFDFMVCDEAHDAPNVITNFLTVQFNMANSAGAYFKGMKKPADTEAHDMAEYIKYCENTIGRIQEDSVRALARAKETRARGEIKAANRLARLLRSFRTIIGIRGFEDKWVHFGRGKILAFAPINPGQYAEEALYRRIPKVLPTSASVVAKTLDMIGIPEENMLVKDYPHSFPLESRRLLHLPTVRMNHRITPEGLRYWLHKADMIIGKRSEDKGIFHTVSYARAKYVVENSKHRARMLTHTGANTMDIVEQFKQSKEPLVLVSPAVTTGFDFPYCLAGETRVLTRDLRWMPLSTVAIGDALIGFDERLTSFQGRRGRPWKTSYVVNVEPVQLPSRRLYFDNGLQIVASDEHGWLVRYSRGGLHWVKTKNLRWGKKFKTAFVQVCPMWETGTDYAAGYLAGAFDGEGSLYQKPIKGGKGSSSLVTLNYTQLYNEMLIRVQQYLKEKGFRAPLYIKGAKGGKVMCVVRLGDRSEAIKFLGSIRPARLLPKFRPESFGMLRSFDTVRLVDVEEIGEQPLIGITTTTKTFVAEGFGSHNSECRFQIIGKLPYPDTRDPLTKARCDADPDYASYTAMQHLVQTLGRACRAEDDYAETFIIDDNITWFINRNKKFAPRWFPESYKQIMRVPDRVHYFGVGRVPR